MISNSEMIKVFGQENLIYVDKNKLINVPLPNKTKEFILNTGFPHLISYFRFTLDFEPISQDVQIGNLAKNLGGFLTIGCKAFSPLIGRLIHLSELGLEKNASLSEIAIKAETLGANEYYNWDGETYYSWRICLDIENDNRIIYINTEKNLAVGFLNSNIQKLAFSLATFWKCLSNEKQNFEEKMQDFEKEIQIVDFKALESENNLWKILIESLIHEC